MKNCFQGEGAISLKFEDNNVVYGVCRVKTRETVIHLQETWISIISY